MPDIQDAKARLDRVIGKARDHWYKPIQIAEVLYYSRHNQNINLADEKDYKNPSLHWRDKVTQRLLKKASTSSAQFQHNVWGENAMPPELLMLLDSENKATQGAIERYIYLSFERQISLIGAIIAEVQGATKDTFDLQQFLARFEQEKSLRRSVDKIYEMVVYALFSTIVAHLNARVTMRIDPAKIALLREFEDFARLVLGITPAMLEITQDARLYRAGVTNAADCGLDMWANFGPAIQVKHIGLSSELAENAASEINADQMILVCRHAEASVIQNVLAQAGLGRKIRGIITEDDLITWYEKCLRGAYSHELAADLLRRLAAEFALEFPQVREIVSFFAERGYDKLNPSALWQL